MRTWIRKTGEKRKKGLDLGARMTHKIGIAFAGTCVGNAR